MTSISVNVDFCKKVPGILKLCQMVLGIICVALAAHYTVLNGIHLMNRTQCFFLISSVTFFICTTLMIISCLLSENTESRLRQTLFEPLYHGLALIFYISGSIALLADMNYAIHKSGLSAAGGIGIVNSIAYGISAFESYKSYSME